jgi:hypothetical protein
MTDLAKPLVMKGVTLIAHAMNTTDQSSKSGRKIITILEKNPKKDPDSYDEVSLWPTIFLTRRPGLDSYCLQDDLAHMRKVVSYCKRHLAQEEKAKQDTNSKSYKSLKNWGHDAQKA